MGTGPFNIAELARGIEAARNSEIGAPRTSFDALALAPLTDTLESAFTFDTNIPATERRGLVWRAVVAAAEPGVVTGKSLQGALVRAQAEWLQSDLSRWSVVTRLSLPWVPEMRPIRVGESALTFYRSLPTRYSQREMARERNLLGIEQADANSAWVRIAVDARNIQDAFQKGSDALDFVRGLLNFRLNRRVGPSIMASGIQPPINSIRPGPMYSVFDAAGTLESPPFWFEECDRRHRRLWRADVEWGRLSEICQKDRRALNRTRYRKHLHRLFRRYARCLDSTAWDIVIVRLWAILEAAVGTDRVKGGPTIKRTLSMIRSDHRLETQLLRHMQMMRNGIVHHDAEVADAHKLVTRLKFYVEAILHFHLAMGHEFECFDEAVSFLSLGADRAALGRRKALIERYLALR